MKFHVTERRVLLTAVLIGLTASGIHPKDHLTWLLEVLPILIGVPILVRTYARFPLTPLVYRLLAGHAVVLMVGAHYTYAEVPLGRWGQDAFGLARNHYDRLGHFAQGFVPAMVMRELLLRTSPLQRGSWLLFLVCSVCLAFSALYELFEWSTALMLGQSATAFLATQGDEWDTQWDMFLAVIGSITAQLILAPLHDRQLHNREHPQNDTPLRPHGITASCAAAMITATLLLSPSFAWSADGRTGAPDPIDHHVGTQALQGEHIGLFFGSSFLLTTGRCDTCQTPPQARWYFSDDAIAIPADPKFQEGQGQGADTRPPFLVWLGDPELIAHAVMSDDHAHLELPPGTLTPFRLTPKLATNQSYFNEASADFFSGRPLRLRGHTVPPPEGPLFEARTIWPADFLLSPDRAANISADDHTIPNLIEASNQMDGRTITTQILWERAHESWAGKPVLGAVLNGAQGDDDEAHGGHFGIFTGRVGPHGEWADWLVNNFYDSDFVSEKGIRPAMVPIDNYLMDLNSGQAYYRPSALLVMILKHDRIPAAYQAAIQNVFRRFYRHEIDYDHSLSNCAGLSIDQLRVFGWNIPFQGPSSRIKAVGGFVYLAATDRSLASGAKIYRYFSEEMTRLLPRVAFEAIGNDLLRLLHQADPSRRPMAFEEWLIEDVDALLYVHIPQIPSSRAMGAYAVASLDEYQHRVPSDRTQWKTIPTPPRPFPNELRVAPIPVEAVGIPMPVLGLAFSVVLGLAWSGWALLRRAQAWKARRLAASQN